VKVGVTMEDLSRMQVFIVASAQHRRLLRKRYGHLISGEIVVFGELFDELSRAQRTRFKKSLRSAGFGFALRRIRRHLPDPASSEITRYELFDFVENVFSHTLVPPIALMALKDNDNPSGKGRQVAWAAYGSDAGAHPSPTAGQGLLARSLSLLTGFFKISHTPNSLWQLL